MRPVAVTVGVLMCGAAVGAFFGMRKKTEPASDALIVPRTHGPITIDGELDEPSWTGNPARTGAFPGKPYSDARMLADDTTLYVALYAADEDLETRTTERDGPLWLDDAFRLVFDVGGTKYKIEVSPKCIVTDGRQVRGAAKFDYAWNASVRLACDTDGTINEPADMDEEWVVEMALPIADVGLERGVPFGLTIERCDTPKHEQRACTSWSHEVVIQ
jgi:hypothetical protein